LTAPKYIINEVKNTLRIGTCKDVLISIAAQQMFDLVTALAINCELVNLDTAQEDDLKYSFCQAIIDDKIDTFPFEMHRLPIGNDDDEIIVSALAPLTHVGEGIIILKNEHEKNHSTFLHESLPIGVSSPRQQIQLENLFPNQKFEMIEAPINFERGANIPNHLHGIIISKFIYETGNFKNNTQFIPLHPKELIPAPGQGCIAYLCHKEDLKTRRILNQIHHKSLVQTSNTERQVLKLAGSEFANTLGVYCNVDKSGYFHIHAVRCDQFKKVSFSQSVSTGLAEKVFHSLFS
jgi:hydroxymethylbilane synthase